MHVYEQLDSWQQELIKVTVSKPSRKKNRKKYRTEYHKTYIQPWSWWSITVPRDLFSRELVAIQYCRGVVPVPKIKCVETFPRPKIIFHGVNNTIRPSPDNIVDIVSLAAQTLAKIHSIKISTNPSNQTPYLGNATLQHLTHNTVCLPIPQSMVKGKIIESDQPVLLHGDYHFENILFRRNKTTHEYEVAAVIDFEEAAFGDPAWDVAYFCRCLGLSSFKKHKLSLRMLILYFLDTYARAGGKRYNVHTIQIWIYIIEYRNKYVNKHLPKTWRASIDQRVII